MVCTVLEVINDDLSNPEYTIAIELSEAVVNQAVTQTFVDGGPRRKRRAVSGEQALSIEGSMIPQNRLLITVDDDAGILPM